ncbi:MAG: cyclopropane-fatty-acyl-phospholipid synthase family protein, partial [Pseudomonadota bacterium]|nr:cyclopropane-fatty-acyl-phospholipid synthase family protein [Pseudomonadota bacterium]
MSSLLGSTTSRFVLPQNAPAAARAVFRILSGLRVGSLDLQLPDGSQAHFAAPDAAPGAAGESEAPRAAMRLVDWSLCRAVLKSGDIGFAETFIAGGWTSPDLAALLKLFIANREAMEAVIYGTWWGSLAYRVKHLLNRNSRQGSRKNIHAHYDIGNPFYRLWLDETMNYSSALFEGDFGKPTAEAQLAKVRRAVRECQVQPGQRLLEIGCGWGALAETAAHEFGAHVTGVTLSTEQLQFAQERLARVGLAAQSEFRLQDYRDIDDAPFDAVVSIEMFEAVGRAYWDSFFTTLSSRLKPGGRACIQTITIADELFERYRKGTDFIQQFIFPGGMLPSPSVFEAQAAA